MKLKLLPINALNEPSTLGNLHQLHQKSKNLVNLHAKLKREDLALKIIGLKKRLRKSSELIAEKRVALKTMEMVSKSQAIYSEALLNAQSDCANLAFRIAEQIIGDKITTHPKGLCKKIALSIEQLAEPSEVIVQINPMQTTQISNQLKNLSLKSFRLITSPNIEVGNANIITNSGSLEFNWRTQLNEIKREILNTLLRTRQYAN